MFDGRDGVRPPTVQREKPMADRCRQLRRGWTERVAVALMVLVGGAALWPGPAQARESDNSRLGARAQEIGTTQEDTLEPPADEADWRYVKIKSERELSIRVELESGDEAVTLELTEAAGDELASVESSGGAATIRKTLSPGIYYYKVESDGDVSYSITVE